MKRLISINSILIVVYMLYLKLLGIENLFQMLVRVLVTTVVTVFIVLIICNIPEMLNNEEYVYFKSIDRSGITKLILRSIQGVMILFVLIILLGIFFDDVVNGVYIILPINVFIAIMMTISKIE